MSGMAADVRPFIDDMAQALADCDVIVCRAGAVTVSELCAAGVPSLLVPLVGLSSGWLVFGEAMQAVHFAGGALLMAGLLLNVLGAPLFARKRPSDLPGQS
jgi:hypothetical protein